MFSTGSASPLAAAADTEIAFEADHIDLYPYPSRAEANHAEAEMISKLDPEYNVIRPWRGRPLPGRKAKAKAA